MLTRGAVLTILYLFNCIEPHGCHRTVLPSWDRPVISRGSRKQQPSRHRAGKATIEITGRAAKERQKLLLDPRFRCSASRFLKYYPTGPPQLLILCFFLARHLLSRSRRYISTMWPAALHTSHLWINLRRGFKSSIHRSVLFGSSITIIFKAVKHRRGTPK